MRRTTPPGLRDLGYLQLEPRPAAFDLGRKFTTALDVIAGVGDTAREDFPHDTASATAGSFNAKDERVYVSN